MLAALRAAECRSGRLSVASGAQLSLAVVDIVADVASAGVGESAGVDRDCTFFSLFAPSCSLRMDPERRVTVSSALDDEFGAPV